MSCHAGDVACQLARIVDALNGWSWPGFASTLFATLVGAAVALLGAALLARRDRAERYQARLDEALARLIALLTTYGEELFLHRMEQTGPGRYFRTGHSPDHPLPSPTQVEAALDVVRLLARGTDEAFATEFDKAFRTAILVFPTQGLDVVQALPGLVLKWRHGESLESIREAIATARKGYDVTETFQTDTPTEGDA